MSSGSNYKRRIVALDRFGSFCSYCSCSSWRWECSGNGMSHWRRGLAGCAFAMFLVAVTANEPIRDKLNELNEHRSVIRRLIARLERNWDQLASKSLTRQLAAVELPGHRRDVAGDLDLLGRASLFHLVSMAATAPGIRTLAQWLAGPADQTTARQRASRGGDARTVARSAFAVLHIGSADQRNIG